MLNMNEDREMERFEKVAREITYDLDLEDPEYIRDLIAEWAVDSQSNQGVIMQIAAAQEFGATLSDYTRSLAQRLGIKLTADFSEERQILRWFHDNSDRQELTVYRGTDHGERNALESWTTDRQIAEFYVQRNGGGEVVELTTSNILATWRNGLGLECAQEVIVINL